MPSLRRALLVPALAAAVPVSSLAVLAAAAPAAHAADRPVVLTHGHLDLFEVTYDRSASGLTLQVGDDTGLHGTGKVYREPADVTVAVDAEDAAFEVPQDLPPSYAFLGEPGDTVYVLPFSQDPALPWPGWSTERLTSTLPAGTTLAASGQPVRLSVEVEGPGDVHSYMQSAFGEPTNHYVDTTDGGPDTIPIARNAHVHTEWVFTEQGDYTFTVTPSARTEQGTTLAGPAEEYHVRVGDEAAPSLDLTVTPDRAGAQYLYGQGITLDAAPSAATDLDHYHWFVKRAGEPAYAVSDRSSSAQLKLPTSLVWDGAQVYAELYDHDHSVAARSEPLTLHVDQLEQVTALTTTADKSSYAVGDVARLTSAQDPATGKDHFHWYLRKPGEEFFTYVPGSNFADLDLPVTADLDGAEVQLRLFDEAHAVIAESAPLTLDVADAVAATTTTLTLDRAATTYGTARAAVVRVTAGEDAGRGAVAVRSAGRVLGRAALTDGEARILLPRTLGVGRHPLTAVFTPADGTQEASTSTARTLRVARAGTRTTATAARTGLRVAVTSALTPRGRVELRRHGRTLARAVLAEGRAVLPVRGLSAGRHRLVVRYLGSAEHAASQTRTTVRVTRR